MKVASMLLLALLSASCARHGSGRGQTALVDPAAGSGGSGIVQPNGGGGGQPVPEPATLLLVGTGILIAHRRRSRQPR